MVPPPPLTFTESNKKTQHLEKLVATQEYAAMRGEVLTPPSYITCTVYCTGGLQEFLQVHHLNLFTYRVSKFKSPRLSPDDAALTADNGTETDRFSKGKINAFVSTVYTVQYLLHISLQLGRQVLVPSGCVGGGGGGG